MDQQWWYEHNERPKGPVSQQDLLRLLDENHLTEEDFVWQHGMRKWTKIGELKGNLIHGERLANKQEERKNWKPLILIFLLLGLVAYISFNYGMDIMKYITGFKHYRY